MNGGTETAIINGKKVILSDGTTVADARKHLGSLVGGDQFLVEDPTVGTMLKLGDHDRLEPGRQYRTIPPIVKG